ncbi:hypothetical protein HNP55_003054 [Paucibacter oligotrophus]|uniref:Uncharacterized protein n=1 Tax=Roseateles oligotrophus TaxID=1769250 RepID=A0A840L8K7_9BURK|nr:hypothetical protein [Roseateles oligotrophus]
MATNAIRLVKKIVKNDRVLLPGDWLDLLCSSTLRKLTSHTPPTIMMGVTSIDLSENGMAIAEIIARNMNGECGFT